MAKKAAIEVMNIHVLTPNPAYSRADGVNIGKEAEIVTKKTMIVLEAKLNKLLQRKSEIQNQNKKTKDMINHYRILRVQTDCSHSKFEATLAETKETIEATLAESAKVIEERERIVEKKDMLERLNIEEQQKFVEEFEEMGKYIIDQNEALEDSMMRERKADRQKNHTVEAAANDAADSGPALASDLSLEEEVEMAKQVGQLTNILIAEQNSLADLRKKISSYESMFEQLKKMTGVESLAEMVSNYIQQEEEMFSLYNFIQTVNTEIDTVIEATQQTEAEIKKFRADQHEQDQQRRSIIDELQNRLTSTLEITRQLEEQNGMQQESVSQISKKVSNLFFKLQCDQMDTKGSQVNAGKDKRWNAGSRPDNKIAVLTGQGVSESNVLEYLGCIEQRAVDIISEYLRVTKDNHGRPGTGSVPTHTSVSKPQPGARSPTPGPSSPMRLRSSMEGALMGHNNNNNTNIPMVDVNNLTEDDLLDGSNDSGGLSGGVDNDSKPVDLNLFKNKLHRKLGMRDSNSSGTLFRASRGGPRK